MLKSLPCVHSLPPQAILIGGRSSFFESEEWFIWGFLSHLEGRDKEQEMFVLVSNEASMSVSEWFVNFAGLNYGDLTGG